ncbi:MAG: alpha/beta hydrolase [Caulobacter sp.]|nr:alpha/beta hydrolase [Caulobacter sp.]
MIAFALLALLVAASALIAWLARNRSPSLTDDAWSALVDPHRRDVVLEGGVTMHCIDLGSGEPVVLIHGIGDSAYSWRQNAHFLVGAGFRVILVDQPGFGRSAIPPRGWSYSVENQAEAILGTVDRLGIGEFNIVAHSLGGGEALYLATAHSDRVIRLAVISPVSQRTPCPFGLMTDLLVWVIGVRRFTALALRSAYFRPEKVSDVQIDEYARPLARPGRLGSGVLGGVCRDYFSHAYDRMAESYRGLRAKLLIIWGEQDTWHPVAFGERLHSLVVGSRLELIPEAGHNVHQEGADLVNPLLARFLGAPVV